VDLYRVGLAPTVEAFFAKLMARPGAVRDELHRLVEKEA